MGYSSTRGNSIPLNRRGGVSTGSGRPGTKAPFGYFTVTGKENDVIYVSINDIYILTGPGVNFVAQAIGGTVSIDFTLAPSDLAMNPAQTDLWVETTPVAPGSIVELPLIFTAMRITFTDSAIVYFAGA